MWMLIILPTNTVFHSGLLGMNSSQHILCHLISCVYCEHFGKLGREHQRNLKKECRTLIKLLYQTPLHAFKLELVCTDFYSFLFITSEEIKITYQVNSSFLLPSLTVQENVYCERQCGRGLCPDTTGKDGQGSAAVVSFCILPPPLSAGRPGSCSPGSGMWYMNVPCTPHIHHFQLSEVLSLHFFCWLSPPCVLCLCGEVRSAGVELGGLFKADCIFSCHSMKEFL